MVRQEDDGLWLEHEEVIASHPDTVMDMLVTSEGLSRWFPLAAQIDPTPGGLLVLGWDEKMKRTSTVTVLDYDAQGRIVWDWLSVRGEIHAPLYWSVEPVVEEGTRVRLRQGPFQADDLDSLIAMAEEAQFWTWHLCNMRSTLEAKLDMRRVRPF